MKSFYQFLTVTIQRQLFEWRNVANFPWGLFDDQNKFQTQSSEKLVIGEVQNTHNNTKINQNAQRAKLEKVIA